MYRSKVRQFNVRYIAIHATGTSQSDPAVSTSKKNAPYHMLIDRKGIMHVLRQVKTSDGTIDIAYEGGKTPGGQHADTRTDAQSAQLFDALVLLSEQCPEARIVGADKLYDLPATNPGFDVSAWLANYIPDLKAA